MQLRMTKRIFQLLGRGLICDRVALAHTGINLAYIDGRYVKIDILGEIFTLGTIYFVLY